MDKIGIANLTVAIMKQAVQDYKSRSTTRAEKEVIIKDLNSEWMDWLSDGVSKLVAEKLQEVKL